MCHNWCDSVPRTLSGSQPPETNAVVRTPPSHALPLFPRSGQFELQAG